MNLLPRFSVWFHTQTQMPIALPSPFFVLFVNVSRCLHQQNHTFLYNFIAFLALWHIFVKEKVLESS